MSFIDNEILNKIITSNDIVDIIGSYLSLIPKGKNYFCVCPFHDDHSPSMSVSPQKQIFRCFVCGETGNSISFLMRYLNISFVEAVKILSDKSGIHLDINETKKTDSKYDKYYDINAMANAFFKNNLNTKEGAEARKYLDSRNITKELIDEFDIGVSLNEGLGKALSKKYSVKELVDLDLVYEQGNVLKDIFYNRLIFPIKDSEGNVVAFSGRIYKTSADSKYRNTSETIIFKKGKIIYNFSKAKEYIRKAKEVIICEGFMDTIRLHSIGIKNTVALMGSSMTKEQLEIIKNLKVNVVLNLDQDDAGKLGTYNIGEEMLEIGINPKVIVFSKSKDSDDLITKFGKDEFITAYRNKVDFIDFKLDFLKKNKNLDNAEELSKYINEALESINNLNDSVLQEIKISQLSEKYNINKSTLLSKIVKKEKINVIKKEVPKLKLDKYLISEIRIIYLMLNYSDVIKIYEKNLGYLNNRKLNSFANEIISYKLKYKIFDYKDFITSILDNEELNNTLKFIMSYQHMEDYTDEELEDYINTVKLYSVKKETEKLTKRMNESIDINEKKELLEKIVNMKKDVLEW